MTTVICPICAGLGKVSRPDAFFGVEIGDCDLCQGCGFTSERIAEAVKHEGDDEEPERDFIMERATLETQREDAEELRRERARDDAMTDALEQEGGR